MTTITITGEHIRLDVLRDVFRGPVTVELAPSALENLERAHKVIIDAIERGDVVYAVNTGYGKLADRRISPDDTDDHVVHRHFDGMAFRWFVVDRDARRAA